MAVETLPGRTPSPVPDGFRLDAAVALLCWLTVAGIAADFRAHAVRDITFAEEGFLTPEHVFFYATFLGIVALVGAATYATRHSGASWVDSVPPGYGWAFVGMALFGLGGVGDFLWHSAFGFERGLEALTSPSHLALAVGGVLFLAAPLRACLLRAERPSGWWALPATLSASLTLTLVVLFGGYLNPVLQQWAYPIYGAGGASRQATLVAIVGFPAVLVGASLVLDRAARLPPGAFTLLVLHPGLASAVGGGDVWLLAAVLAAGVTGDLLYQLRSPLSASPVALRSFGALVPVAFAASYFAVLELRYGVTWSVHLWTGAVVLSGAAGVLVTYVALPISPAAVEGEPS